jgi:hypothetical protein
MAMDSPDPSIVRLIGEGSDTVGSVLVSVIVPLTLKLIVSVPVPAAQSPAEVSDAALALLIASRRVQNPLPEVLAGSVEVVHRYRITARAQPGLTQYKTDRRKHDEQCNQQSRPRDRLGSAEARCKRAR